MRPKLWSGLAGATIVLAVGAASIFALHTGAMTPRTAQARVESLTLSDGSRTLTLRHPRVAVQSPPSAHSPSQSSRPGSTSKPFVIGSYQQQLINRDRAAAGLPPLTWSSCLASVAAANAVRLSLQGWTPPYHTNGPSLDLNCRLGRQAGENVGYWSGGINDSQLNSMFMASPDHHANIMGRYHYVATAWAVAANGSAYVAVEFA